MHRSSSQYPRSRGEKTVVEGKTIPYVSSKSVFGTPSSIKLSGAVAFAGERLFHANGWNQHTTWNWTVPSDHDIDYISVVCVGGGGAGPNVHDGASGSGGGLSYKNNIPVSPGDVVAIWVGGGGAATYPYPEPSPGVSPGYPSYIRVNGVTYGTATGGGGGDNNASSPPAWNVPVGLGGPTGGQPNTDGGGNGGYGSHSATGTRMGGGGAGGYSGNGGNAGPANGYPIGGHPSSPNTNPVPVSGQAGAGGGGGGAQSANNGSGGGGGGGVGLYGEGTSGGVTNAPGAHNTNWYALWGRGGSTAHNTGLNGYSSRPTSSPITQIPSAYGGGGPNTGHWGVAPPTGPVYPMIVSLNPSYPQYAGDGGFCGGGGCGGHANSNGGRGGHGAVRIVYGYLGPGDAVPTNRREFPTKNVDKSDQYAVPLGGTVAPANITIETDGQQLMY